MKIDNCSKFIDVKVHVIRVIGWTVLGLLNLLVFVCVIQMFRGIRAVSSFETKFYLQLEPSFFFNLHSQIINK